MHSLMGSLGTSLVYGSVTTTAQRLSLTFFWRPLPPMDSPAMFKVIMVLRTSKLHRRWRMSKECVTVLTSGEGLLDSAILIVCQPCHILGVFITVALNASGWISHRVLVPSGMTSSCHWSTAME